MVREVRSVSSKGQVTIPVEIRNALHIEPNDKVAFTLVDGEARLTRARSRLDLSFRAVTGLKPPVELDRLTEIAATENAERAAREGL